MQKYALRMELHSARLAFQALYQRQVQLFEVLSSTIIAYE